MNSRQNAALSLPLFTRENRNDRRLVRLLRCGVVFALLRAAWSPVKGADYVVIITVDGLRASIFAELSATQLPNYTRLRTEGAATLNARTDFDWTFTNPNHVSILSARQVIGTIGHIHLDDDPTGGRDLALGGRLLPHQHLRYRPRS